LARAKSLQNRPPNGFSYGGVVDPLYISGKVLENADPSGV